MRAQNVPAWCRWRNGRRPLLLIAPHGGRAAANAAHRAAKVNDVHTAELTWALASALDASAIINPALDRNLLDLNRVTQVLRDAAWFPALIEHLLGALLAQHARVEVLFMHGWNVIQPKCDIGVGACFATEADAATLTQLTAGADYVRTRLREVRTRCAAVGVHATYGERYPASHRNNLIQLFRRDGTRSCPAAPQIVTWAAAGRLDAVQLELGVPLRWPGPLREAFTGALIGALTSGDGHDASVCRTELGDAARPTERVTAPLSVHAPVAPVTDRGPPHATMLLVYDPRAALGFMGAINVQPNGHLGARLLVFSHGQTMALFTGEDPACRQTVIGGPQFRTHERITELAYRGALLEVQDAAAYVSLEQAFMQSRLIGAKLSLSFTALHGAHYGHVHGTAQLNGITHHIDTFGFRNVPIFLRREGLARTRCAVAAAFGADGGVHVATTDNDTMSWTAHSATGLHSLQVPHDIQAGRASAVQAPGDLLLRHQQESLLVRPLNHMQIHRPLPDGHAEMIFLGLASFSLNDATDGYGFYEYVRPFTTEAVDRENDCRKPV